MSDTETAAQLRVTRSNFASRMLTKELDTRMKTTQQNKITTETGKFPTPPEEKKD